MSEPKIIIGLETHVQLKTRTKLFCGCGLENLSSAPPNARTCDTCLGLPGSKPRTNKAAVEAAIKVAKALGCTIAKEMFFSRKNYLYPDMPKNYQITQFEVPIASGGFLEITDRDGKPKKIRITRINLEEDPGKLVHVGGGITTARYVLVDYNRSGIPLVEIVTEPDFSTTREARTYLQKLMAILKYLDVFKPDEFTIKADANISISGSNRVEIKNITGFKEIERALQYEIFRQKAILREGGEVEKETRGWDEKSAVTRSLRKKEAEEDYGYILEPDLRKTTISGAWVKEIAASLPELPHQKVARYIKEFMISREQALSITSDLELAQLYEQLAVKLHPGFAATWMDILKKTLSYNDMELVDTKISLKDLEKLLSAIKQDTVTDRGGELILRQIISSPEKLNRLLGDYSRIGEGEAKKIVKEAIREERAAVVSYKQGNKKALQYIIGQIMKKSKRKIDARLALKLLKKELK